MQGVQEIEVIVMGEDMNGYVGNDIIDYDRVHERY